MDFHKYYFDLMQAQARPETGPRGPECLQEGPKDKRNTSLVAPHIIWMCNRKGATVPWQRVSFKHPKVCFKRLVQAGTNVIATEELSHNSCEMITCLTFRSKPGDPNLGVYWLRLAAGA